MVAAALLGTIQALLADGPPSSGGPYQVDRYTVDAGGGESSGDSFTVTGTIAQHDAGELLTGGPYDLQGGFWPGLRNLDGMIFRDSFESGPPQ